MQTYVAAAVQMTAGTDVDANLAAARALAHRAVERGARLVVLPEVFAWRGPREHEPAVAESIPGRISTFLAALARELAITLVGGSFLETAPDGGKPFNTSLAIGPDGAILAAYRKIHLFDVDLPGRVTVRESDTRGAGRDVVTATSPLGILGLSICYDLRFPELYRRLATAGATVLTVPAAFTFFTGAAHWETLLRARAIENQAYVIAPNQAGVGPTGIPDFGSSMIVDPWGTVLARAGTGDQVVTAEIDEANLARVRGEMPCLAHARLR